MGRRLLRLPEIVAADPDQPVGRLDLLSAPERRLWYAAAVLGVLGAGRD